MRLSKMLKKEFLLKLAKNLIFMTFGAIIAGFALEAFLVPHEVIDGGIIGISMILSHVTKFNLGLLIILLNTV